MPRVCAKRLASLLDVDGFFCAMRHFAPLRLRAGVAAPGCGAIPWQQQHISSFPAARYAWRLPARAFVASEMEAARAIAPSQKAAC